MKDDSYTQLRGEIGGPPGTPYEGGTFILDIKIPDTYPFNPPKVRYTCMQQIYKKNLNTAAKSLIHYEYESLSSRVLVPFRPLLQSGLKKLGSSG